MECDTAIHIQPDRHFNLQSNVYEWIIDDDHLQQTASLTILYLVQFKSTSLKQNQLNKLSEKKRYVYIWMKYEHLSSPM